MSAEVIKEFLCSLSFSKDEAGFHRTMESVESLTKKMVVLGGAIEAAAIASVAAIHRIAMGMEAVGYASSRVGASVSSIKEFQFAISQLGGTAAGAMASLENFSRFLRETPGGEAWLRTIGVATRDTKGELRDRKALMDDFFASKRFTTEPYWAKLRDSRFVGIDEDTMRAGMNPQRAAMEAEARAKYRNAGADPEKMAEAGKSFEQIWRSLGLTIDIIGDKIAMAMAGPAGDKFRQLINYLDRNSARIADGLIVIGNAIVDCAGQLISWIGHVAEWEEKAEKWISANPRIAEGLKQITDALGPLGTALAALVTGAALRGLVGLLGLAGLGSIASFIAGGAMVGGALSLSGDSAGADEKAWQAEHPESSAKESWIGRTARDASNWVRRQLGMSEDHGGGNPGEGSSAGNLTKLIDEEARKAGIDPRIMQGIRARESLHANRYDKKDDALESSWGPFQLNRRRGLGVDFERDTGLDLRNPETIPAQARWVANYLKHGGSLQPWAGYHGPRDADPRWGDSGYHPTEVAARAPAKGADSPSSAPSSSGLNGWLAAGGGVANAATASAAPVAAAPIGHSSVNSYDFGSNVINHKPTFNINAAGDPGATADAVAKKQGSLYADALRNLQGSIR